MKRLLLIVSSTEASYSRAISTNFKHFASTKMVTGGFTTAAACAIFCLQHGITHIATTVFVSPICPKWEGSKEDNIGTVWKLQSNLPNTPDISCVLLPDLQRYYSQSYMPFLMQHYFNKLAFPETFLSKDSFSYKTVGMPDLAQAALQLSTCLVIAIDIETSRQGLITSCSYTGLTRAGKSVTFVVPVNGMEGILCIRRLNALKPPKIMQNGQYDCTYFLVFNAPVENYLYDTYNLAHCLFPELPRDLSFISSFFLLNYRYWKSDAGTNLYMYNGKDTHNTLWAFFGMIFYILHHGDTYALKNYVTEFPKIFPCLHCGLEGAAIDLAEREVLKSRAQKDYDEALAKLHRWLGCAYNPSSPVQTVKLLNAFGFKATSSDDKTLQKFKEASPLHEPLVAQIVLCRERKKAIGTYYEFELKANRLLYQLDPGKTDTGRLASKKSNLWCGTQIQNIPGYAKSMVVADKGFTLFEIDNSQSESRCTAYMSQDLQLINNVETSPDFHCSNGSMFFGIPFEELFSVMGYCEYPPKPKTKGEVIHVLLKPIRNLSKRVNHGANYNMGPEVLWETMGTKEVLNAAKLLGLATTDPRKICKYLLDRFDATYPRIRGEWYAEVIREAVTTGRLIGPTGWTRRTFLRPDKSKLDLNSLVAHGPQSLSVMLVNEAFFKVWLAQLTKYSGKLRLKAQIHDSIFGQIAEGHEEEISNFISTTMREQSVEIHGRHMVIPNDISCGKFRWSELK